MFDVECVVGRLVEIRVQGRVTMGEVTTFRSEFMRILATRVGQVMIATDWRGTERLDADIVPMLVGVARGDNPRIELSGWLAPDAASRAQIRDMLTASRNPSRLHFDDAEAMATWLGTRLEAKEVQRLRTFLGLNS